MIAVHVKFVIILSKCYEEGELEKFIQCFFPKIKLIGCPVNFSSNRFNTKEIQTFS